MHRSVGVVDHNRHRVSNGSLHDHHVQEELYGMPTGGERGAFEIRKMRMSRSVHGVPVP